MIDIRDLSYKISLKEIFAKLNLNLGKREIRVISGPSGCGKTSLLRLIAGLATPCEGQILLNGKLVSTATFVEHPRLREIDMLFQEDALWPGQTILDQIQLVAHHRQNSPNHVFFEKNDYLNLIVNSLGIRDLLNRKPEGLSGGEARRCQLARVLVNAPRILLLDEPTAFLDEENVDRVRRLLEKILPGLEVACIIVSHEASTFSDNFAKKVRFEALF